MARGKSAAEKAKILERQAEALKMRRSGFSYRKIGARLGVNHTTAFDDVQHALAALAQERSAEAEHFLDLELARLDMLLEGLYRMAEAGNPNAVEKFLKVCESRRKLLGLDAPTKISIENNTPIEKVNEFIRAILLTERDPVDVFNKFIEKAHAEASTRQSD